MKYDLSLCVLWIGILSVISGCQTDLSETVEETDAEVYRIIDANWHDSIGEKGDFRIADFADNTDGISLQVEIPVSRILTLPQAVALATARNRFYAREKELLYLTALDQIDTRHLYEPIPFSGGQAGYFKDNDVSGTEAFGTFGLNQLLATGAQIGGDISLGWVDILSGDFRSGFSAVATAVVTQPLLRGAGRKVVLENLTQAQRNTLYQVRTFNRYRQEFVTSIISDYYLILQLNDRHLNTRSHYYALTEMYGNLHKRAASGKLPQHELNQAEQDRLEAMSDYIQSRKDYKEALDAFKTRLSIPPTVELSLDMEELHALKRSIADHFQIAEEEALRISRDQRLDLLNAADRVDDAKRKVEIAADAIRAELNLIGAADSRTLDSRTTQESYQLSLQLDLPIDRLTEKNAYRRSLISLTEQQRAYEEAIDAMTLEVRTAYRRTQEARQRYEIERESRQLADLRSKNTLLLLQYDRANTRDVLDAQEDLLEARNAITEAIVDYAIAGLEFFRDTGTMKIKPDGMWEHTINFQVAGP